jgi:hypothetical protein
MSKTSDVRPAGADGDELNIRGLSSNQVWDFENGFYWFSAPNRLGKLLTHYDLYKSITGLPGDVFEFGVYKAASLLRFATLRGILENEFSRRIVGFDAFGKFPTDGLSLDSDLTFIDSFEGAGGLGLSRPEVEQIVARKGFRNVGLVEGNVFDTLPQYLERKPETRLSLLHLDMDVKEPTEFVLELLYDRVVAGGLIVLDDYATIAGETEAVDAFVAKRHLKIEKNSYSNTPSIIRKPFA